jgi:hypothetical protein
MFAMGEDPFAIHLLVQSVEKLLIDLARNRGVDLAFDWEAAIKTEYQREFFKMHWETYNFFKHADKDTADLPVHNWGGNANWISKHEQRKYQFAEFVKNQWTP